MLVTHQPQLCFLPVDLVKYLEVELLSLMTSPHCSTRPLPSAFPSPSWETIQQMCPGHAKQGLFKKTISDTPSPFLSLVPLQFTSQHQHLPSPLGSLTSAFQELEIFDQENKRRT